MRVHRFYIPPKTLELTRTVWLHDTQLLHQWSHVLRFQPGQQIVLFDGQRHERLYKLIMINASEAQLELITDYVRKLPPKEIYLFWSLLKKAKNDWVLQKGTELGVSHFVPLQADRCEKTGFNAERAQKIIIEAAEQCNRSDIPSVREPLTVADTIREYGHKIQLVVAEAEGADSPAVSPELRGVGVLIGPEGGWSEAEKQQFQNSSLQYLSLHDFTLRAETACIVAITKLLQ